MAGNVKSYFRGPEGVKYKHILTLVLSLASSMEKVAHPLLENSVVPAHGRSRFDVAFQAPINATKLVLYYRGFNREEKHPVELR